eukprot:4514688-Amphidinium_carterae.1
MIFEGWLFVVGFAEGRLQGTTFCAASSHQRHVPFPRSDSSSLGGCIRFGTQRSQHPQTKPGCCKRWFVSGETASVPNKS